MFGQYSVVETEDIGSGVKIAEFAVIRAGVKIGDNVVIHPHVVIESGAEIGDDVEIYPGTYIGKAPRGAGATARPLDGYEKRIVIGAECAIGPHAVIYYDVAIGNNTLIGDGASVRERCRIGSRCVIGRYVTVNYNATIGDGTKVMDCSNITGNCRVGSNVFIGMLVATTNDNLKDRDYDDSLLGPRIEDDAIIGTGAVLLPNVHIGTGAMVGANALVSKDVPAHTLVMGVPATIRRSLKE